MDTWAPSRRSLITCYFLWVRVCFLRVCDRDIPAAETWEGVTYETLDSALSGDWGVLKCQNSNFLQTVTPSHTLWPSASLSHSTTHSAPKSDHPELVSSFSFFYPKHCLSFSLRSIHKVPQGEILSHCTVMPPPPPSLRQTKHSLFLFTLSFQANSEERKRGKNRGESLRIAGPSYFPEMLQPIPKLWANEGGSFTTHALLLQ